MKQGLRDLETNRAARWSAAFAVTAIAVAASYAWLDRPIARLVHRTSRDTHSVLWEWLSHIPNPLLPLAVATLFAMSLRMLWDRPFAKYHAAAFVGSLSVLITETTKDQLKFLFGRTWPESWLGDNPSFIRDGVFGFHFFHGGSGYQSFPSGHMATACAVLAVLWTWFPGLKAIWLLGGLAIASGLVVGNYHFLGDVCAGAFLGVATAALVERLWAAKIERVVTIKY